jgi:hypothetical protein
MSLQHYIPAGFLGRFSSDVTIKSNRDKVIAVADLAKDKAVFQTKAAGIGGINNFYDIVNMPGDPKRLDRSWNGYEVSLNVAIDSTIKGTLDAVSWSRILVPFITGLMVRGPEFDTRYMQRPIVAALSSFHDAPNHITMARVFEMQRLLGPILTGEWYIAKTSGNIPLITNDVGFVPFLHKESHKCGAAIPVDQRHVIVVVARTTGRVLTKVNEVWYPLICPVDLEDADNHGINVSVAKGARRFIYGGSVTEVEQYRSYFDSSDLATIEPAHMGFVSGLNSRDHEFTWHRLISFLYDATKSGSYKNFPIDWAALDDDNFWSPLMMVPLEARPFCPTSITQEENAIVVDLSEVPEASKKPVQSYVERTWLGPGKLYSEVHPPGDERLNNT